MPQTSKEHVELWWISLILRFAMALLFFVAALAKFQVGLPTAAGYIIDSVKGSFIPSFLLVPYAYVLPFAEALIAVWLVSGYKLRAGWAFTAAVLITLAFGMLVGKQPTAANLYIYLLTACAGLYLSKYDRCVIGGKK